MTDKIKLKVLVVAHFEVGEMSGDFPGEAQYFYENYCLDGNCYNPGGNVTVYTDKSDKIGLCVTGSGKVATALTLTSIFCDKGFDFSDTLILGIGCAGGSFENTVSGDICVEYAAADFDLGHSADIRDFQTDTDCNETCWFEDSSYSEYSYKKLSKKLADSAFCLLENFIPTQTEASRAVTETYGKIYRKPAVIKGTAVSGDNFWKGINLHNRAKKITEIYGAEQPYTVCEMEDIAMAVTAERFGLLQNLAIIRIVVNYDIFTEGETPYSLWKKGTGFNDGVENGDTTETADLFPVAMKNLFDAGKIIIDAKIN